MCRRAAVDRCSPCPAGSLLHPCQVCITKVSLAPVAVVRHQGLMPLVTRSCCGEQAHRLWSCDCAVVNRPPPVPTRWFLPVQATCSPVQVCMEAVCSYVLSSVTLGQVMVTQHTGDIRVLPLGHGLCFARACPWLAACSLQHICPRLVAPVEYRVSWIGQDKCA